MAEPSDASAVYTALAALLTACTGMISAVVAGVVTLRRRRNGDGPDVGAVAAEVARLLEEQEKRDHGA